MGKWIAILLGLILIALGIWGIIKWPGDIWNFVKGGLVIAAIIVGLGAIAFGWSELRSAAEERRLAESAAAATPPPPPPSTPSGGEPSGGDAPAPPSSEG
jgi:hypothetical protein